MSEREIPRIPREVTQAVRQIAAGLVDEERTNYTGWTEDLRGKYGDDVVDAALIRMRERIIR